MRRTGRVAARGGRSRHQPPAPDETLAAAYEPGLSLAATAAGLGGVSTAGVRAASRRAGKPLSSPSGARAKPLPDDRGWGERYAAAESAASIARDSAVGRAAVRGWLKRRGVAIRDPAGAARARAVREGRDRQPRRSALKLRDGTRGRAVLALLAEHPGGLSTPQCAELNGEQPGQTALSRIGAALRDAEAARWVRRAGKTPGRWGQAPAVIWVITGAGRAALAAAGRPRPAPQPAPARERPPPPEHPWAADAEKRVRAGEPVTLIARVHGVCPGTVGRALDRRNVPHGRAVPPPEWAGEAKALYEAGEPASALASRYGVSHNKLTRELRKQGVTIRNPKQARQAKSAAEKPAQSVRPRLETRG
jgi:hypothetical protein